jgi:hypothetical protein
MNHLTQRLRMTEGQTYSAIITLVLAVLLLLGLGNLHGVISSALAQAPLPLAPVVDTPVTTTPVPDASQGPIALPTADPVLPVGPGPLPQPAPNPAPQPTETEVPFVPEPVVTTSPSPTPTEDPCQLQAASDAATDAIKTANAAAGGRLPEADVLAAIGIVTGCDPADPAVVAVGLLIGVGQTLPDPGIGNPAVLPYLTIPGPVIDALQPGRPAIDQACGLVGTGQTVASLFISAYPQPVPQLTSQVLFTALSVCGQVRNP